MQLMVGSVLGRLQCIHGECVECVQEPAQQEATIGPVSKDYKYASAEAVERWHDMKFGLRIHWGLYSIQGAPLSHDLALAVGTMWAERDPLCTRRYRP